MRYLMSLTLSFLVAISLYSDEVEFQWADSPLNRHYIKQITYQTVGVDTVATIECADNTQWKFIATPDHEIALFELGETLEMGSEVFISPAEKTPNYWLGNKTKFRVNICKESLPFLPVIVNLEKIIISEASWFSSEESKYLLTLSDGSLWELKYTFNWTPKFLSSWRVGNHIIIGRNPDFKNQPLLINVEAPHNQFVNNSFWDFRKVDGWYFKIKLINPPQ